MMALRLFREDSNHGEMMSFNGLQEQEARSRSTSSTSSHISSIPHISSRVALNGQASVLAHLRPPAWDLVTMS